MPPFHISCHALLLCNSHSLSYLVRPHARPDTTLIGPHMAITPLHEGGNLRDKSAKLRQHTNQLQ
jgi:hypothetical protein